MFLDADLSRSCIQQFRQVQRAVPPDPEAFASAVVLVPCRFSTGM
jgi:hypothetical protein